VKRPQKQPEKQTEEITHSEKLVEKDGKTHGIKFN